MNKSAKFYLIYRRIQGKHSDWSRKKITYCTLYAMRRIHK